jgi:multimeric flavodoxin WrbA
MKVMVINGNPKEGGFVHGCLDALAQRLERQGAQVETLHLRAQDIQHCTGCFACLRTGVCVLQDSMNEIAQRMRSADGFVIGCSVRNGYVTALYKTFYERITYPLIFTGDLVGKLALSVSSVGKMGGRRVTARFLGLKDSDVYPAGHLFFYTDIPTSLTVDAVRNRLDRAADRFLARLRAGCRPGPLWRIAHFADHLVMRRFLLAKKPDVYAHVIDCYRKRGWMK